MVTIEGICIKNYGRQLFAKKVNDAFKEANRMTFGGSKKNAQNDEEEIVLLYCTNPRIDKQIFSLIDEGRPLEMTLMGDLIRRVNTDIFEEHGKDIFWSQYTVDFKKLRNKVAERCRNVLHQMMTNEYLKTQPVERV